MLKVTSPYNEPDETAQVELYQFIKARATKRLKVDSIVGKGTAMVAPLLEALV